MKDASMHEVPVRVVQRGGCFTQDALLCARYLKHDSHKRKFVSP